jgi:hypothetical protein
MESFGLEFYTTKELIHELMRRQTFLGVVLHSHEEFKDHRWGEERTFQVHFNSNLDVLQTGRLLETVAEYIDRHHHPDAP